MHFASFLYPGPRKHESADQVSGNRLLSPVATAEQLSPIDATAFRSPVEFGASMLSFTTTITFFVL